MKTRNILIGLVTSALFLAGCAENELPSFPESKAFISFTRSSLSIDEVTTVTDQIPIESDVIDFTGETKTVKDTTYSFQDSLMIEVLCSSLSGVDASIEFEIVPRKTVVDSTVVTYEEKGVLDKDSIWVHKVNGVEKADTLHAGDSIMFTRDSVKVIITDKGAKVGEQFTFTTTCGDTTLLTFDKNNIRQYIIIKPIDNATFDGDKFFTINLKNAQGAELGASNSCEVSVVDDEHPLAFILGSKAMSGMASMATGLTTWPVSIEKDPEGDVSKVFITNFTPLGYFSSLTDYPALYGFVNETKDEIEIPANQVVGGDYFFLFEFYTKYQISSGGADVDGQLEDGESLKGKIAADGTITLQDVCVFVYIYADEELTKEVGLYEIMYGPATIK